MLTPLQRDALAFVATYQRRHGGVSPSCDEVAAGVGLKSKGWASKLLTDLERKGKIRRLKGRCRAIEVVRPIPIYRASDNKRMGYLP